MNRKMVIVALVAAMALTLSGLAWAHEGCDDCDGQCVEYPKRAHMPMLTAEQREEVKARAAELNEQGASPEEVRAAIAKMLKEWGIQPMVGQSGQQAGPRWGQQAAPPRWGQQGMGIMQQGRQQAAPPRWGQQAGPPGWGRQAPPPYWGWGQPAPPPYWGQQPGPRGWGQPGPPPYSGWGQQVAPPRWGQPGPPPQWGQPGPPPYSGWGQQAAPPYWGQQGPPPQWGQQQRGWRGQQGRYGLQAQRPGWQMMMPRMVPAVRRFVRPSEICLRAGISSCHSVPPKTRSAVEVYAVAVPVRVFTNWLRR